MKNIVIGQYIPGNGFLYKLDPRTKIIAVVTLMVSVFLLKTMTQLVVALGLAILILIVGKLSILRIVKGLKPLFVLLIFTFIFQIFFNREGTLLLDKTFYFNYLSVGAIIMATIIWRLLARLKRARMILIALYLVGLYFILSSLTMTTNWTTTQFQIYEQGLIMSVFVVVRLLVIITLSTVLTLTTKPTDLTQGLERLMRPLRVIGINSEEFSMIVSISLRYIPTILDEANKIMLAQASRGADFAEGKLKDKIKQIISLLVPMFIIAFIRSEDLADAMESRNFVPGQTRTRIHNLHYSYLDVVTALITVVCLASSILLRIYV
jgi:energy-coupling factor transport system permease protein